MKTHKKVDGNAESAKYIDKTLIPSQSEVNNNKCLHGPLDSEGTRDQLSDMKGCFQRRF